LFFAVGKTLLFVGKRSVLLEKKESLKISLSIVALDKKVIFQQKALFFQPFPALLEF
jgi:hypothetical protein